MEFKKVFIKVFFITILLSSCDYEDFNSCTTFSIYLDSKDPNTIVSIDYLSIKTKQTEVEYKNLNTPFIEEFRLDFTGISRLSDDKREVLINIEITEGCANVIIINNNGVKEFEKMICSKTEVISHKISSSSLNSCGYVPSNI